MHITFLGTKGDIEDSTDNHKYHSSIMIAHNKRILVDYGLMHVGSLNSIRPDVLLLTHAHPDHAFGLIRERHIAKLMNLPIYMTERTKNRLSEKMDLDELNINLFNEESSFDINGIKITSIPVLHSIKAPAVAFMIEADGKKLLYVPDMLWIKRKYYDSIKGIDLMIGDGSSITQTVLRRRGRQIVGHMSMINQLKMARDIEAKNVIFTHVGKEILEATELKDVLDNLANVSGHEGIIGIAEDGDLVDMEGIRLGGIVPYSALHSLQTTTEDIDPISTKTISKIVEPEYGIHLSDQHAIWIHDGKKTGIVYPIKLKEHVDEPVYLVGDNRVYGIIKLQEPSKISREEFHKLRVYHLVTDNEWIDQYESWNNIYYYHVDLLNLFSNTIEIEVPDSKDIWIKVPAIDVTIDLSKEWPTLERIDDVFAKKLTDKELRELHDFLHEVYKEMYS